MKRFLKKDVEPRLLSPITLAFIGDCVYELFVREDLVTEANRPGADLHAEKIKIVNAKAQQASINFLMDYLTENEKAIFKRGRNAHTGHTPKNMSSASYHAATGFEALIGYLYLNDELDRIRELYNLLKENGFGLETEK